ncbi:hypothetical protein HY772_02525 [Candidatus Woesearchaeota archaeon]|nr:hypothetical protein [Candidatus Woesearchaeota archaeon]
MENKQFIITKKIASQGKRPVILIPALLQKELKPDTVVKLTIDIIKQAEAEEEENNE